MVLQEECSVGMIYCCFGMVVGENCNNMSVYLYN